MPVAFPGPLAIFAVTLLFFHVSEILLVVLIEPEELELRSSLISVPYLIAMSCGLFEHAFFSRLLPAIYTRLSHAIPLGIALIVIGEAIRKTAWLTAGASFTHRVKYKRRPAHRLIKTGIYRWVRHPGYIGWLIWCVGTQVLLGNPLCTVAFAVAAWTFFSRRIPFEDELLEGIFGREYVQYRESTPSGIPGIK